MTAPTATAVRAIISTELTDEQVEAVIADAELMVESCSSGWGDARYTSIVKWLTAHLISSMPSSSGAAVTLTSQSLGGASESYARATLGEALKGTMYGQQALMLDTTGCLTKLGKRRASFSVL